MISYESSYSILIGHRIRNERIALGMTQSEFAKLLGISPSYLGALERGTRPVSRSIMNRLHEKTHISYDYLLEGLEKPDDTIPIMQNIVAEPEHYRVRRDIGLLLASCSVRASFRLGVPGSGKSFSVKEEIVFLILNTDDDILIADPEGEYAPLIEAMDGLGAVIRVAAGGKDRLNAMYMVDGYGENNPIVVKSQFIMSLVERIDPKGVGAKQKSIIDRCTGDLYEEAEQNSTVPTLAALREKLMEQPEAEAREIALALELFTTGSLDIFGHDNTVDLDKRVVVFDIHGLGEQLKPIGHLVITDTMLNRVTLTPPM